MSGSCVKPSKTFFASHRARLTLLWSSVLENCHVYWIILILKVFGDLFRRAFGSVNTACPDPITKRYLCPYILNLWPLFSLSIWIGSGGDGEGRIWSLWRGNERAIHKGEGVKTSLPQKPVQENDFIKWHSQNFLRKGQIWSHSL